MMLLLTLALFGASALQSDTSTVTDWVKNTSGSFWQATVTPTLPFPDGRYVVDGAKDIRWDGRPTRAEGIVFVPTGMENQKKAPATAPAKKATRKSSADVFNLTPVPSVTKSISAGSDGKQNQVGVSDLGILSPNKQVSNVNTDEILSYFQKTNITTGSGNEETGAIINADQNAKLDQPAPSSATFESQ